MRTSLADFPENSMVYSCTSVNRIERLASDSDFTNENCSIISFIRNQIKVWMLDSDEVVDR